MTSLRLIFTPVVNGIQKELLKKNRCRIYQSFFAGAYRFGLVFYSAKIGGINRLLPILEELSEIMKPSKLYKEAQLYGQITSVQRLGYLLDKVLQNPVLSDVLKKYLSNKVCYFTPLSTAHKNKESVSDKDWKIIINIDLEK
ncbi:hypothetical protein MASR2M47_44050 [Draconibacterium sp.]